MDPYTIICANVTLLYIHFSAPAVDVREKNPGYRMLSTQLAKTHANDVFPGGLSGYTTVLKCLHLLRARPSTSDPEPIHPL